MLKIMFSFWMCAIGIQLVASHVQELHDAGLTSIQVNSADQAAQLQKASAYIRSKFPYASQRTIEDQSLWHKKMLYPATMQDLIELTEQDRELDQQEYQLGTERCLYFECKAQVEQERRKIRDKRERYCSIACIPITAAICAVSIWSTITYACRN